MEDFSKYNIHLDTRFGALETIDIPALVDSVKEKWFNITLCKVNDSVVRLGIVEGEFHWHKHDEEDEFFYVVEGELLIDVESADTVALGPKQGYLVPRGVVHRTRAPKKTVMIMIEGSGVIPTGD